MREIRFRGRKLYDGKWAESVCPVGIMVSGKLVCNFDLATVGQYTGLKDKNGKRIFEGDIVRHYNNAENYEEYEIGVFQWNERYASFERTSFPQPVRVNHRCLYEVCGNIHDNPELLEGGQDNG